MRITTCSCTAENGYWSSSLSVSPGSPWFAAFNGGVVNVDDGGNLGLGRAVRGGS